MSTDDTTWSVWVQILFEDRKLVFTGTEADARKVFAEKLPTLDTIDEVLLFHGQTVMERTEGTKPYVPAPSPPTEPEPPEIINPEWMAYELALHSGEHASNPYASRASHVYDLFEAWRLGFEASISILDSHNPYPQTIPAA